MANILSRTASGVADWVNARAPGLMPVYEQAKANLAAGGAPAAPGTVAAPTQRAAAAPKAAATEQQELDKFLGR